MFVFRGRQAVCGLADLTLADSARSVARAHVHGQPFDSAGGPKEARMTPW